VFQQSIFVNPRNGKVGHPEDDARVQPLVTMSCYLGAPATVARWGYEYGASIPSGHFYFDAAVQMKRASYCADEHAYTIAGTEIFIRDSAPVHQDATTKAAAIEASWTRDGAKCLNPNQARHPELLPSNFKCPGRVILGCGPNDIVGGQNIYDALTAAR
jgi:hypothetical protein